MESFSKIFPKNEGQVLSVEMRIQDELWEHARLFEGDNLIDFQEDFSIWSSWSSGFHMIMELESSVNTDVAHLFWVWSG